MTTKHTQGPWCVKHDKTGMPYIGVVIDPIDYPGTVAIIDSGYPEADARLIAAAPDLLAALEQAKSMLETASRYFPKSIKNSDRFSLLNTLANSVNPSIAKARGI